MAYCTPEMAELVTSAENLLSGAALVAVVDYRDGAGNVVGHYYMPLGFDLKARVMEFIARAHHLGYAELLGESAEEARHGR